MDDAINICPGINRVRTGSFEYKIAATPVLFRAIIPTKYWLSFPRTSLLPAGRKFRFAKEKEGAFGKQNYAAKSEGQTARVGWQPRDAS